MSSNGIQERLDLENGFKMFESPTKGRGLVATRNFEAGEVIFQDFPFLLGPRVKALCVGCHSNAPLTDCPNGCHLPVCSPQCSQSPLHTSECALLRRSLPGAVDDTWKSEIICCIVVLRCLFLSEKDKDYMKCFQSHEGKIHGFEAKLLKKYLGDNISPEEEEWLISCCHILDTNAFDVSNGQDDNLAHNDTKIRLRGLYRLAGFMNHDCSPNTCLSFNSRGVMYVSAAKPILAGEEMTTIYCTLMWNTPTRRNYINETKHFLCECDRCKDPTEFGANLSALSCPAGLGYILPTAPLNFYSPWRCKCCQQDYTCKQISFLLMAQAVMLSRVDSSKPTSIQTFLEENNIPPSSQEAIALKLEAVQKIGNIKGLLWEDLTDNTLELKETWCRDILRTMDSIQIGCCRSKGIVLLELHCTLCEKLKRLIKNGHSYKTVWAELNNIISEAQKIYPIHDTATNVLKQQINVQRNLEFEIERNIHS